MKLVAFSVKNYRSITKAYKLPITDFSVLLGPNNEGKSNILRALVLALETLSGFGGNDRAGYALFERFIFRPNTNYKWATDFPLNLQGSRPNGKSEFTLEFRLTPTEFVEFKTEIGVALQTHLKIRVDFEKNGTIGLTPLIQGKRKSYLIQKREAISRFVGNRIFIRYIPSDRSSTIAQQTVQNIVDQRLDKVRETEDYKILLKKLESYYQPIIDSLSSELVEILKPFIPQIRNIKLEPVIGLPTKSFASPCSIHIDDGVETDLELKGDGVQSLAAISIIRHATQELIGSKNLILIIEEPELHLHPKAVALLRSVLSQISEDHQVLASSHSPLLADRVRVYNNIIVRRGNATAAKTIKQVRDVLGVKIEHNLASAELVVLVEGEEDKQIFEMAMSTWSEQDEDRVASGRVIIVPMGGASKLPYFAALYRSFLCNLHAIVDNDEDGIQALKESETDGNLTSREHSLIQLQGMRQSEIEDLVESEVTQAVIDNWTGVKIPKSVINGKKQKWSDRIGGHLKSKGKRWTKTDKAKAKKLLSSELESRGLSALSRRGEVLIKNIIEILDNRFQNRNR